jgi:hypothetical protein
MAPSGAIFILGYWHIYEEWIFLFELVKNFETANRVIGCCYMPLVEEDTAYWYDLLVGYRHEEVICVMHALSLP